MNTEPIRKWWTVHRNDVGRELADPGWAEWAGKRVAELEAENATLRDALSDALWRMENFSPEDLRGMNNHTVQIRYGDT